MTKNFFLRNCKLQESFASTSFILILRIQRFFQDTSQLKITSQTLKIQSICHSNKRILSFSHGCSQLSQIQFFLELLDASTHMKSGEPQISFRERKSMQNHANFATNSSVKKEIAPMHSTRATFSNRRHS